VPDIPKRILNLFGATVAGRIKLLGAALTASLASVALAFALVYRANASDAIRAQTAVNCQQTEALKSAIRQVLSDGKTRALDTTSDPAARQAISSYYNRQLARFRPLNCPNP
jgi:hypothetical protein